MSRWRRIAAAIAGLPIALRVVVLAAAVLHGCGLSWGMPASDGWDVDGVAPRDVLPGLAATFTPGHYYTYPPFHLALLAILTLPVTLVAALEAGTTATSAVVHEILAPSYMTVVAMTARIVTLLMSLGVVVALAKVAEEIAPDASKRRVATWTAVICAIDAPFTYYAHVTNLDVPYLFWAAIAMLGFVRAIARRETKRLRSAAIFVAFAIATKDQAYAMFLVGAPLAIVVWLAFDRWPRKNLRGLLRDALGGAAIAIAILLVVDGAIVNPSGFRARLAFLSGSASQDYATYSGDAAGRWLVLVDTVKEFERHYPWIVAIVAAIGFVDAVIAGKRNGRLAAALVPLAIAVSFTLCFNLTARRVEERFTLPQTLSLAVYAGFGLARIASLRWVGPTAAVAIAALALWPCIQIDATLLQEPRYDAESWLRAHTGPEDVVEVHGLNVYLARFWPGAHVVRVGPTPADRRNPMPGVTEVQAPLAAIAERHPRFVAVSECYAWRYMERDLGGDEGHIVPKTQTRDATDADATALFQGLFHHRLGYHLAHESRITSTTFPRFQLHASLGCPMFIFERDATDSR